MEYWINAFEIPNCWICGNNLHNNKNKNGLYSLMYHYSIIPLFHHSILVLGLKSRYNPLFSVSDFPIASSFGCARQMIVHPMPGIPPEFHPDDRIHVAAAPTNRLPNASPARSSLYPDRKSYRFYGVRL